MTVRDQVEVDTPPVVAPASTPRSFGWFPLLQVPLFALTVASVVIGWRIAVPGGMAPATAVAFGLTLAWALVGIVDTRAKGRVPTKASPFHLLAATDALVASVALAAGRKAEALHAPSSARDVATLAALVVTAISFHFLLALPDGRLHDGVRRTVAIGGYTVALATGLGFVLDHRAFSLADGAISWSIAGVLAIAPMRSRYIGSIGYQRERMEWFGIGVTAAATVALMVTVLHLLVGWPGQLGAVTAAATVLVPLGLLAGESKGMGPHASRGLVQVLAVSSWSPSSTWWWCSAWVTRRRPPVTRRSSRSPWWPRVSPPSSSYPCGHASSIPRPDSSTDPERRRTRSCGPSGAG
jgi:hypothetical protein